MRMLNSHRLTALLLLAVVVAVSYRAWGAFTRPQGAQKAIFRPAVAECAREDSLRYCVYRDRAGTNGDIVYHLHGRNLDEQVWNDDTYYTGLVQAAWQQRGVRQPTVVSLSYGGTWLLAPKGRAEQSGLLDDLMRKLPAIEQKIGAPRRRMLLGESMGGLNVLVADLFYPDQFDKIAALCPGVYEVSPFSSFGEIRTAMRRTGADPRIIFGIWKLSRSYYADDAEWRASSPLTLIEKAGPNAPELYLSNGLYDAYGNFEGTQKLAERASALGIKTAWHPLYGGHCASDAASLAAFLAS